MTNNVLILKNGLGVLNTLKNKIFKESLVYQEDAAKLNPRRIEMDVVIHYEVREESEITKNPTMSGVNRNDHSFMLPTEIVVEFGVSDLKGTAAKLISTVNDVATAAGLSSLSNALNISTPSTTLSQSTKQALSKAQKEKILFVVDTGVAVYKNMQITKIHYLRDKATNKSLKPIITLTEWMFVEVSSGTTQYTRATTEDATTTLSKINKVENLIERYI